MNDANSEVKSINNLRYPLAVQFYGEQSEDYGGPREEFYRLALGHIRTFLVEGPTVKLLKRSTLIANQNFYTAGVIIVKSYSYVS